ncbi:MAG: radical SAM protein, partial [Ignavibacteriaceae bacterium]
SIEPNLLTDEILELTASSEKMCKHFHIPLQSGSPKILRSMRRRYKVDDYYNLIHKVKKLVPDIGIGVDVITGFPGENENDFLTTYNFLNELPVSYLHAFSYSERPDTHAITLKSSVDVNERRKRTNMLRILSEKKKHQFYSGMINKELEVLFESNDDNGFMKGFSSNYVRVQHLFNSESVNRFIKVKIKTVTDSICSGELIEKTESKKDIKKSIDLIAC